MHRFYVRGPGRGSSESHFFNGLLAAVPGPGPKFLLIDALDAARGGPVEGVFASLIEQVRSNLAEEWVVVASIRTFDLRNGWRYRQSFTGVPANPAHADSALGAVRHFLVPRLTDVDLATAGAASPEMAGLLTAATPPLARLLCNVFNLSLAAELMAGGARPADFAGIGTQSDLLDVYEDRRMRTTGMTTAAADAAVAMVTSRRLAVRKVDVRNPDLDRVIQSGVLTAVGDLVSFAHNVLFDHVAGRYHLDWNDPDRLISQLEGDPSTALLLAPALRFAVERIWRFDSAGKPHSWRFVCGMFAGTKVDAVLGNVALRIISESVDSVTDLAGLLAMLKTEPDDPAITRLLRHLSRFVVLDFEAARIGAPEQAIAWASLAEQLTETGRLPLVDPARVLIHGMCEHADLTHAALLAIFGRAARALLALAWSKSLHPQTTGSAIRSVGRSFASDPAASKALLDRILREPHFSKNADREAHWLAGEILPIARADPSFATEIYAGLYGQMITDTGTSALGGHRSRIMPLSSNRRQDYEHALWHLGKSVGEFLVISPEHGTRSVIEAVIGKSMARGYGDQGGSHVVNLGFTQVEFRGIGREFNAWDEKDADVPSGDADPLAHYVAFLRSCDVASFGVSVAAASRDYATAPVWTRILGVASERVAEVGDLIWPIVTKPDLITNSDTLRDAIRFVATAWPTRSNEERRGFEEMMFDDTRLDQVEARARWRVIVGRLLALIPQEALVLGRTRDLRRQLEADGELTENRPIRIYYSSSGEHGDYIRHNFRREGVEIDVGPNRLVLDALDALKASVNATPDTSEAAKLATLWSEAAALIALIDANPGLHGQISQSALVYISNAVERVASSDFYDPCSDGLPDLDVLFAVLARLYENKEVIVYAAKAWVSLASRFAAEGPELVDRIGAILTDHQPIVRLQAAMNLQVLCMAAPERMWEMGERIAATETDADVLTAYLGRSLRNCSHVEPERCEHILTIVRGRLGDFADDASHRDKIQQCLGSWVAQLQAKQGRPLAGAWLEEWAADPERFQNSLIAYTSSLRRTLFRRYAVDAKQDDREMNDRAQEGLAKVLGPALDISARMHAVMASDAPDEEKHAAGREYSAAEQVIKNAMNQLYFGAEAHAEDKEDGLGLNNAGTKARILVDYANILALLRRSHEPATLHQLIELYEHLIPGDPVCVFTAIHAILTGPGTDEGYQFEILGCSAVVNVVKRYIADHRGIFENPERRAMLVEILQMFSEVGWPDAIKLLYELPDLLR